MARTIVVATDKGGDGKSTASLILAEDLAYRKAQKVLLIDLDPQGNSSKKETPMEIDPFAETGGKKPITHPDYDPNDKEQANWDGISSTADIFMGKDIWPYPTALENLSVIPAYGSLLEDIEAVRKDEVAEKVYERFGKFIQLINDQYDFIILDTRPSKGPLTSAALRAANYILIPAQMEQFSIDGIYGMLQMVKAENYRRNEDNPLKLVGILPNMERNTSLHKQFKKALEETPGIAEYVIPVSLKKRTVYAELMVDSQEPSSIHQLQPSNPGRIEAEAFCEYVFKKVMHA